MGPAFMGRCLLPISQILSRLEEGKKTFNLRIDTSGTKKKKKCDGGTLTVSAAYVEMEHLEANYLVAEAHFSELLDLFFHKSSSTNVTCRLLFPETNDDTATAICELGSHTNKLKEILKRLVQMTVQATKQESTLFRTNSLATKLIRILLFLYGEEYLRKVIKPFVTEIIEEKESLNPDPDQVISKETIEKEIAESNGAIKGEEEAKKKILKDCQDRLESICRKIMNTLLETSNDLPSLFYSIFSSVRFYVAEKFPNSKYLAVGGFFFLRFLVPLFATPKKYNMVDCAKVLSKNQEANLVLVSKVILSIVNGKSERKLKVLDPFIQDQMVVAMDLLDKISTRSPGGEFEKNKWIHKSLQTFNRHSSSISLGIERIASLEEKQNERASSNLIESMASVVGCAASNWDAAQKDFEEEGNVSAVKLISQIRERLEEDLSKAKSGRESLLLSSNSDPISSFKEFLPRSHFMWKMPRGVVINSGKVVEKEVQNVPAGQFSVKFGIIPKNMVLLRITFSVFVLSCSGEEVFALKPVTKGQGDPDSVISVKIEPSQAPATVKFSFSGASGVIRSLEVRALIMEEEA